MIAYASRQFSAAEQNYHTGERELCALHRCTTVTWRHYLIFTNFRLQGDHRPLEWLMEPGRELSRRQARWYMDLVEVGVPRMEYIKGALLMVPDALSRRPDYKDIDAREGLREAGMLDPTSDLPTNPCQPWTRRIPCLLRLSSGHSSLGAGTELLVSRNGDTASGGKSYGRLRETGGQHLP